MAESEKKEIVTLLNRSKRHYDTINAEGKNIRHSPGHTMEYTVEQAAQFDSRDMADISKLPGSVDKEGLRKENAALKAENVALKAQLAALTPSPVTEEPVLVAVTSAPVAAVVAEGGKRKK